MRRARDGGPRAVRLALAAGLLAAAACSAPGSDPAQPEAPTVAPSASARSDPSREVTPRGGGTLRPRPGTVPPPWLGTRVLPERADGFGEVRPTPRPLRRRAFTLPGSVAPAAELPGDGFAGRVVAPAPARVIARSTWEPRCPVGAGELAWVRVAFHGFDDARHTGELLVASTWAEDVVDVFAELYAARFPIEQMRITRAEELDVPPTGDGNNTGAFVCRPVTGGTSFSEHAYGRAIDVNPFQNPYVRDDLVVPELASAYLDRDRRAPGIIREGGPVVEAFARIGWVWGGDYTSLRDWQHFSSTGG
ncbi:M15 family metallopeptidase [Nocardioidaceae bacterium]|nr:M15 family metallopeptidase [Nocardioidaceae bacterium]